MSDWIAAPSGGGEECFVGYVYDYIGAHEPETYELENQIADPEQRIERFMESLTSLKGAALADIGAGAGFHACRFAQRAAQVFAVEPAPQMQWHLFRRLAASRLTDVSVLAAEAGELPLPDELVDVVHSRFAYFFGPERETVRSCEPGIREAMRILKPGGVFFIIDNALTTGQFAGFLSRFAYSKGRADAMQQANDEFYGGHGFQHTTIESTWTAPDRETLRRVIAMEFAHEAVEPIMAGISGTELSYHYRVYYRQKPAAGA
jgi:ubiquinone/menaquinone biosynthesis C-methylase UbiE